jgi:hypothetical protein
MFGLKKKTPYTTIKCSARKLNGAAHALAVNGLDLPALVKAADASEHCTRIAFGQIYQKPGTLLADHRPEEQGYVARHDRVTQSLGLVLRQGLMRQTLVFSTKEPQQLAAAMGITLEQPGASEPTVS